MVVYGCIMDVWLYYGCIWLYMVVYGRVYMRMVVWLVGWLVGWLLYTYIIILAHKKSRNYKIIM